MFKGLTFKEAEGQERARALELQRQVYMEDLGHVPGDDFDERAYFLIAHDDRGEVVATFRMVGPNQRPFDLERFVSLTEFIADGRSPAVVGRLCIRRDYRTVSRNLFIQIGILKLAYAFARKRGITDFILYTYPDLIGFYRTAFFRNLERAFDHPDWGTVYVMHLDLIELEAEHSQSQQPVARLLFGKDLPNIRV